MAKPISIIEKHFDMDQETALLVRISADLRISPTFQSLEDSETDARLRVIEHYLKPYGLNTDTYNRIAHKLSVIN